MEMTLNNLVHGDRIDHEDFLARADILGEMGWPVLISNYGLYYRLAAYLCAYLVDNRFIEGIRGYREDFLPFYSDQVLGKIRPGNRAGRAWCPRWSPG